MLAVIATVALAISLSSCNSGDSLSTTEVRRSPTVPSAPPGNATDCGTRFVSVLEALDHHPELTTALRAAIGDEVRLDSKHHEYVSGAPTAAFLNGNRNRRLVTLAVARTEERVELYTYTYLTAGFTPQADGRLPGSVYYYGGDGDPTEQYFFRGSLLVVGRSCIVSITLNEVPSNDPYTTRSTPAPAGALDLTLETANQIQRVLGGTL